MPRISVVVPVRSGGRSFQRCLKALTDALAPADELIVVLDGPDADARRLAEEASRRAAHVRLFQHHECRGPAAARNTGARAAEGAVLFFVDADVLVPADAIERVQAFFVQHPGVDALIGSYDDAPADPHVLSQYRNLLHYYTHQRAREEAQTFWGACGAVRRAAFFAAGGFDAERYRRPCIEDIDFGYRLKAQGRRIRLLKDLQVKHLKRWRFSSMLHADLWRRAAPWTELLLRRADGGLPDDLNTDWANRLSVAATGTSVLAVFLAPFQPTFLWAAGLSAAGVAFFNVSFLQFLSRVRSRRFSACAFPLHLLHYFCGGLGFLIGSARHVARRVRPRFSFLQ